MQDPAREPCGPHDVQFFGLLGKQALIFMKLSATKASDQAGSDISSRDSATHNSDHVTDAGRDGEWRYSTAALYAASTGSNCHHGTLIELASSPPTNRNRTSRRSLDHLPSETNPGWLSFLLGQNQRNATSPLMWTQSDPPPP